MIPTILITGATGNIGAAIVCVLLEEAPNTRIVALVRGRSSDHARKRLFDALRVYRPQYRRADYDTRVEVLAADVSRKRFGLDCDRYAKLCQDTTHIIHSAAITCFGADPEEALAVNVTGTGNVLELAEKASRCGTLKRMLYVSTAYIPDTSSACVIRPADLPSCAPDTNIYERSKWEAERMVRTCFDRLPIVIVRPSIVVGESTTGRIIHFNVLYPPLRLLLPHAGGSDGYELEGLLDVVPVDYVAGACRRILMNSEIPHSTVYHLTAGAANCVTIGDLIAHATSVYGRKDGSKVISRNDITRLLGRLRTYQTYLNCRATFDCSATDHVLRGSGLAVRPLTEYLAALLDYCRRTHWGKNRRSEEVPYADSPNSERVLAYRQSA